MRKTFCLLPTLLTALLFFGHTARAQQIGEWQVYPSYTQATKNIVVGSRIYSLCDGNLLAYDTEDTEVAMYDCLHNLNGVHVNHMTYSEAARRIMLVYDDTNIDLLDANDNVQNLSALRDKPLLNVDSETQLESRTDQDPDITASDHCKKPRSFTFGFCIMDKGNRVFRYTKQNKPFFQL